MGVLANQKRKGHPSGRHFAALLPSPHPLRKVLLPKELFALAASWETRESLYDFSRVTSRPKQIRVKHYPGFPRKRKRSSLGSGETLPSLRLGMQFRGVALAWSWEAWGSIPSTTKRKVKKNRVSTLTAWRFLGFPSELSHSPLFLLRGKLPRPGPGFSKCSLQTHFFLPFLLGCAPLGSILLDWWLTKTAHGTVSKHLEACLRGPAFFPLSPAPRLLCYVTITGCPKSRAYSLLIYNKSITDLGPPKQK